MPVHHRLRLLTFTARTSINRLLARPGISRFPRKELLNMPVLRPRQANGTLAIMRLIVLPSAFATASAPGFYSYAAQ